jgi:hypothetical protein
LISLDLDLGSRKPLATLSLTHSAPNQSNRCEAGRLERGEKRAGGAKEENEERTDGSTSADFKDSPRGTLPCPKDRQRGLGSFTTVIMPPSLPLQSVTAFCLWHEGDLYDNWSAAGLVTSDNAELQAIVDGIHQAYNVGLEDVQQVHVFSDSTNMLHLTMDVSHQGTTLIPIHLQSVGAVAPTPPK